MAFGKQEMTRFGCKRGPKSPDGNPFRTLVQTINNMARALTFFCSLLLTAVASAAAREPNVVLIFADDVGNFFECVKSRDLPIFDAFSHHVPCRSCIWPISVSS